MRQAITQAPGTRPDRYTVLDATELTADRVEHLMKVAFG
jgi:hypothetical protein